jgi:N-acetylglucosamine-6-phosphate deacetylase
MIVAGIFLWRQLMSDTVTAITNARLVLPDRVVEESSLLIEGGRIKQIAFDSVRSGEFDAEGATVFPGFIDVHIHGAVGVDTMNATPAGLGKVSRFLAQNGVTSWLPTLVPGSEDEYSQAIQSIARVMEDETGGARVVGVHYEGPFVNLEQCGALHREHFRTYEQKNELSNLPRLRSGRMMTTLAPEIAGGIELIRELEREGWVISIGHTRAGIERLNEACEAGARHMTHFMNAMAPLHHRNPGPIAWGLSRDDVTFDIVADGMHLDKFVLKLLLKLKGAKGMTLISDAIAAAGEGDGEYQVWGETISVENGRTSNVHGSIAGSVISVLDAFRLMRSLGASDIELAHMASTNPAKLLRLEGECGSIEEGKRADLVVIDQNGEVKLTLVGGAAA